MHLLILADGSKTHIHGFYPVWTSVNNHTSTVKLTYHGQCVVENRTINATQYTSKNGFPYWKETIQETPVSIRLNNEQKCASLQEEIEDLEASIEYNDVSDMYVAQERLSTLKNRLSTLQ